MTKSIGHLIALNDECLYSAAHGGMYAPLRVKKSATMKVQSAVAKQSPNKRSCIRALDGVWCDGKFMLAVDFNQTTKCTNTLLHTPSHNTKTEICLKNLCNGNCTDKFMRNVVAKNILPELYNSKHR